MRMMREAISLWRRAAFLLIYVPFVTAAFGFGDQVAPLGKPWRFALPVCASLHVWGLAINAWGRRNRGWPALFIIGIISSVWCGLITCRDIPLTGNWLAARVGVVFVSAWAGIATVAGVQTYHGKQQRGEEAVSGSGEP